MLCSFFSQVNNIKFFPTACHWWCWFIDVWLMSVYIPVLYISRVCTSASCYPTLCHGGAMHSRGQDLYAHLRDIGKDIFWMGKLAYSVRLLTHYSIAHKRQQKLTFYSQVPCLFQGYLNWNCGIAKHFFLPLNMRRGKLTSTSVALLMTPFQTAATADNGKWERCYFLTMRGMSKFMSLEHKIGPWVINTILSSWKG